jgi:hypothetical protein
MIKYSRLFVVVANLAKFVCFLREQAEREFKVEVEAIGWVRHKNIRTWFDFWDIVLKAIKGILYEHWL